MDRFTIPPTYGTQVQTEVRTKRVTFGDGYEQRANDGINAQRLTYEVKFTQVRDSRAAEVIAFCEAHGGTVAFIWTPPPPKDTPLAFVIRTPWTHVHRGFDNNDITIRFEQDFNPAPRCEVVTFTENSGPGTLSMATATSGATIHFTIDGTTPTETHGTPYVAPIALGEDTPYQAIAFKTDRLPSAVTTHTFVA